MNMSIVVLRDNRWRVVINNFGVVGNSGSVGIVSWQLLLSIRLICCGGKCLIIIIIYHAFKLVKNVFICTLYSTLASRKVIGSILKLLGVSLVGRHACSSLLLDQVRKHRRLTLIDQLVGIKLVVEKA